MTEYSVEEVRARFEAWAKSEGLSLDPWPGTEKDYYRSTQTSWDAYKAAYAERIKTDEGAVPVAWQSKRRPEDYPDEWRDCGKAGFDMINQTENSPWITRELFTRPPAQADEGAVPIRQYRNVCKCPPDDPFCICNTRWQDVSEGYFNLYSTTDESREWRTLFARPPAPVAQVPEGFEFNLECADAALRKLTAIHPITPPEAACIKAVIVGARALLAAPTAEPVAQAAAWMNADGGVCTAQAKAKYPHLRDYTVPLARLAAQPAERVVEHLRELSDAASKDWEVVGGSIGGGSVVGGPTHDFVRGSSQSQIASFSCPRLLPDDETSNPAKIQQANAKLAVECVAYVRTLLAAAPSPGESA